MYERQWKIEDVSVFRFVRRDVGHGHRGIDKGDCTVRALALAAGIGWDDAYWMLADAQMRHRACGFDICEFLALEPAFWGVKRALPFPARKGLSRMTPREFANSYPRGSSIRHMGLQRSLRVSRVGDFALVLQSGGSRR